MTADAIDLSKVEYVNSPDVSKWIVGSEFKSLRFANGTITVDHTKVGLWSPVQYETTTQEATIWVFFQIGGRWFGTGGERLRPGQREKALDAPSHIGPGWLYAPDRWREMANYVPTPGELVGFMVAAGNTRGANDYATQERTNVVLIRFPEDVGGSFPPFASLDTPSVPAPPAELPPPPAPEPADDILVAAIQANSEQVVRLSVAMESLAARLAALQKDGLRVHF